MRPDYSALYSGLGAPTFASSNPGLQAMQAIAQLRQAQASLSSTNIANQGAASLLPGLVPQQQAQTALLGGQANQANAMAHIGIPAQAAEAMAQATIGIPDSGQQALAQAGLLRAQVSAGLPAAQASEAYGYGALGNAEAAKYNLETQYPGMQLSSPFAQLMDYQRYLNNQGVSPSAQSNGPQATANNPQNPQVAQPQGPMNSLSGNLSQLPSIPQMPAGIGMVPGANGSYSPGIQMTSNPGQQVMSSVQGMGAPGMMSSAMPGMMPGIANMGSITNPNGSLNMGSLMNMMQMQALSPIAKNAAQTQFYNVRSAQPYSGVDQNGNVVSYQPTQPTVASNVQGRQLGDTESNVLIPKYIQNLAPYGGSLGSGAFAKDVALANSGNTEAMDRVSSAGAAINMIPSIAASLARTAAGGTPTVQEIDAQEAAMGGPVLEEAWKQANTRVRNMGLAKLSEAMSSGVGSVVNQERGQFAIPAGQQQPQQTQSAQLLPPMPSFKSKQEFVSWAKSLTPAELAYYRSQVASGGK